MDGDWDMMQLLQDEDFQKIQNLINQMPEEELSPAVPGGCMDAMQDSCFNQEMVNQEYFNQEYPNLEQQGCPPVAIKTEVPDDSWWTHQGQVPSVSPGVAVEAMNIRNMDPLPQSPSSWEEYNFSFAPPSVCSSRDTSSPDIETPGGPRMTISRRKNDLQQGKPDSVRKMRRREQNRVAAQRCRNKKKVQTEQTVKDFQDLQKSHDRLQIEVDYLEKERRRLERILTEHLKECTRHGDLSGANEC